MSIYPYQKNNDRDDQDNSEYDLESEKRRIAEGTEEIKKELVVRWKEDYKNSLVFPDKFRSVSPQLIDFLLSYQNTLLYNDIAKKFRLLPEQRDMLPQIVWHICLNNDWERTPDIIKTNLGVSDSNSITDSLNSILSQAKEMVRKQGTISQKYSEEKPAPEKKVSVTLQEALRTYPELGEQSISSPLSVRMMLPTISPRLSAYRWSSSRRLASSGVMAGGLRIQGSASGASRLRTRVWARWLLAAGWPMAPMAMTSASGRGWSLSRSVSATQRTDIWSGYRLRRRLHRKKSRRGPRRCRPPGVERCNSRRF